MTSSDGIHQALRRGVDFLLRGRSADGPWRDFDLEPGQSDSWVTAYVGSALLAARSPLERSEHVTSVVEEAATWLVQAMRPNGSWGYNARVPADADSTAHAVLFLRAVGRTPEAETYARLLELQQPDGGIATFLRTDAGDSWGLSHPDVTPVVLSALISHLPTNAPPIQRGLGYVGRGQAPDGVWQSFWWTTPFYATLMSVRLLEETKTNYVRDQVLSAMASAEASSAFEHALLAELFALLAPRDPRARAIVTSLIGSQLADGSWSSVPMLRVTEHRVATPWVKPDAGPVGADQGRLFTTATVVRALSAVAQG